MKKIILLTLFVLLLTGCGASESAIQTAIAQTEAAIPTATLTPVQPTNTPVIVVQVEVVEAPTHTPYPTTTPYPTYTPYPTNAQKAEVERERTCVDLTISDYHDLVMGEEYHDAGYYLYSEDVEDPAIISDSLSDRIPEGYKFVSVLIVIGNNNGESYTIYRSSFVLVDTEGFSYDATGNYREDNLDYLTFDDMNQGERARGWVSFIIPENSMPSYIKFDLYKEDTWLYASAQK